MVDLSPEVILSKESREHCIENLKKIPKLIYLPPVETASVLVPLCVVDDEVHILYTLRSKNLKHHSGQVSFPGGKSDVGETPIETALRETEEELGLSRDFIDVWTQMSEIQGTGRSIVITPIVAFINDYHENLLHLSVNEVDKVFTVPIKHFCNPDIQGYALMSAKKYPVPVYVYGDYRIWGVTAFITHFLLSNLLPDDVYKINMTHQYSVQDLAKL